MGVMRFAQLMQLERDGGVVGGRPTHPDGLPAEDGPVVGGCSTAVPLSSEDTGVRVVRAQSGEACSKAVSPWVGVPAERYLIPGRA